MALDNKGLFALYVFGTVESNCNWGAVNTSDPITLGIVQWYGLNAAKMIKTCRTADPAGYTAFRVGAPRIHTAIEADHDWNWWTHFYVTDEEKRAWINWTKREENHNGQVQEWENWWNDYVSTGTNLGFNTTSKIKQLVYWANMRHQSPAAAGQVIASCGTNATLRTMHNTCLNNGVLGRYATRYRRVYEMLTNWDGESAPPDFGVSADYEGTGNNASVEQQYDQISRIERRNDQLIVFGSGVYENGVVCTKAGSGIWIPSVSTATTMGAGDYINGGSIPSGSTAGAAALAWGSQRIRRYRYSNAPGRLNPDHSGVTDCSGFVWSCYWYGAGKKLKTRDGQSATWTGTQIDCGDLIFLGRNGRDSYNNIPWDKMQVGDIVLCSPSSAFQKQAFKQYRADAQLYSGTPRKTLGAGCNPNPQWLEGFSGMDVYGGTTKTWAVVRPVF